MTKNRIKELIEKQNRGEATVDERVEILMSFGTPRDEALAMIAIEDGEIDGDVIEVDHENRHGSSEGDAA